MNLPKLNFLLHPYVFLSLWLLSFAIPYFWIQQGWWLASASGQLVLIALALCLKSWRLLGVGLAVLVALFEIPFFLNSLGQKSLTIPCLHPTELWGTLAKDLGTDEHKVRKSLIKTQGYCAANSFNLPEIQLEIPTDTKVAKGLRWVQIGQQVHLSHPSFEHGVLVNAVSLSNNSQQQKLSQRSAGWAKAEVKGWYYLEAGPQQLFQAILLADRRGLTPDLRQKMQALGIFHLFAISGLHVGMLYGLSFLLLRLMLNLPRVYRIHWGCPLWVVDLACWVLIGFYLRWIGNPVTAVRAFWMLGFWLFSRYALPGAPNMLWLLLVAAGMLVLDPSSLGQVGFQLSFLSVAAILISLPLLPQRNNHSGWALGFWLLQFSAVSLSILVWTLPLNLYYFGYINVLSVLNNLIHIPWVGFVYLPSGLFALGGSLLFDYLNLHWLEVLAYAWLNWVSKCWLWLVDWSFILTKPYVVYGSWHWWYWLYFGALCCAWFVLNFLKLKKSPMRKKG